MSNNYNLDMTQVPGQDTWQHIDDNWLHLCESKSVVEIGPYGGCISERIIKHRPTNLTLIEANKSAVDQLKLNPNLASCKILLGDMHHDLNQVGPVDVAIVLGVIYHSHAPLLLLEQLVNYCDPQTILIDSPGKILSWYQEPINSPGMRYVVSDKKTCGIVIQINERLLIASLTNLGYRLHTKEILPENLSLKSDWPIYQFEKNNG
jgi:hypothetical protein